MRVVMVMVGGANDGRRVEVEVGQPFLCLPVRVPYSIGADEEIDISRVCYTVERFIPHCFHANGLRFTVFGLEGMSPDEILSRLIEGYHSARSANDTRRKHEKVG